MEVTLTPKKKGTKNRGGGKMIKFEDDTKILVQLLPANHGLQLGRQKRRGINNFPKAGQAKVPEQRVEGLTVQSRALKPSPGTKPKRRRAHATQVLSHNFRDLPLGLERAASPRPSTAGSQHNWPHGGISPRNPLYALYHGPESYSIEESKMTSPAGHGAPMSIEIPSLPQAERLSPEAVSPGTKELDPDTTRNSKDRTGDILKALREPHAGIQS